MSKERTSDALTAAANTIREGVARLSEAKRVLEAEKVQLERRSEFLRSLPVRREEAKQFIFDAIDLVGAEFPKLGNWGRAFEVFAFPRGGGREEGQGGTPRNPYARGAPLSLRDIDQVAAAGDGNGLLRVLGGEDGVNLFNGGSNLAGFAPSRTFFFFGDLIKAKVDAHFDDLFPQLDRAYPEEASTTLAERRAEIAKNLRRAREIDQEVSGLEQQLRDLRQAGI